MFNLAISLFPGIYKKPFLLVPYSNLVKSGEKVTLECHSEIMFDIFILTSHRKRIIKESCQHSAESHLGGSRAKFSMGPVTRDHAGSYTCYGSYNQTPYEWSESSDPVDIKITGKMVLPAHHPVCEAEQLFYRLEVLGGHGADEFGKQRKAAFRSMLLT